MTAYVLAIALCVTLTALALMDAAYTDLRKERDRLAKRLERGR